MKENQSNSNEAQPLDPKLYPHLRPSHYKEMYFDQLEKISYLTDRNHLLWLLLALVSLLLLVSIIGWTIALQNCQNNG